MSKFKTEKIILIFIFSHLNYDRYDENGPF